MRQLSLKAIHDEYGISRRTIQCYEKEKLIKATGKTNRGYLLYDDEVLYRILFIKYCQNIGFTLKEIRGFINKSNASIQEAIMKQIPWLESKMANTKQLIEDSYRIVEYLKEENCEKFIFEIIEKERKNEKIT